MIRRLLPANRIAVAMILLASTAALSIAIGSRGFWDPAELPPDGREAFASLLAPLGWGARPPLRDALVAIFSLPIERANEAVARAPSLLGALFLVGIGTVSAARRAGTIGAVAAATMIVASPLFFHAAQWGGPTMLSGAFSALASLAALAAAFPPPALDRSRHAGAWALAATAAAFLAGGFDALLVAVVPAVAAAILGDRELRSRRLSALAAPSALAVVLIGLGAVAILAGEPARPPRSPLVVAPAFLSVLGMAVVLPLARAYVLHRRLRETSFDPAARAIALVVIIAASPLVLRDPAAGLLAAHVIGAVLLAEAAIESTNPQSGFRPGKKLYLPIALAGLAYAAGGALAGFLAAEYGAVPVPVSIALAAAGVAAAAAAAATPRFAARISALGVVALLVGAFTRAEVLPLFDWNRSADGLVAAAEEEASLAGTPLVVFAPDAPLVAAALEKRGTAAETTTDPVVLFTRLTGEAPVAALMGDHTYRRARAADATLAIHVRHVATVGRARYLVVSNRPGS